MYNNSWNTASDKHHHSGYSSPTSSRGFSSPLSTHSLSSAGRTKPRAYYDSSTVPLPSNEGSSQQLQIHPILCPSSAISGRLNMLTPLDRSLGVPGFITAQTLAQSATTPARSRIHVHLREAGQSIIVGTSSYNYVTVYDVLRALHDQLLNRIPSHLSSLIESASAAHQARSAQYGSDSASELAKGPRFIDAFRGKYLWFGLKVYDPTHGAEVLAIQLC